MNEFDFLQTYVTSLSTEKIMDYPWTLRLGIDEAEVRRLEKDMGITVPRDLTEFYSFSYGAELGSYRILTIPEVSASVFELREMYADDWRDSILPFACVIDVGDLVAFDLNQSGEGGLLILDCFHELSPAKWKGICFGLRNWLVQMVDSDFTPFWL